MSKPGYPPPKSKPKAKPQLNFAFKGQKLNGAKLAAEALQSLLPEQQKKIIDQIKKSDPQTAELLQKNLYQFNDLQFLLPNDFQFLWQQVDKNQWLLALRSTSPQLMQFIQKQLSARAYQQLISDMQTMGPQPLRKVQEAQKQILDFLSTAAEIGRIALPDPKKKNIFVP